MRTMGIRYSLIVTLVRMFLQPLIHTPDIFPGLPQAIIVCTNQDKFPNNPDLSVSVSH